MHKVIHIPTTDKTRLGFLSKVGEERKDLIFFTQPMPIILDSINLHLYVISDDIITKDDYYWSKIHNRIFRCIHKDQAFDYDREFKVIATTDNDLALPTISTKFIKQYADNYSKNSPITEVSVRYSNYYNFKVGDKLRVLRDLSGVNKDDYITVKSFNHNNNVNLIEFEEDDQYNLGIHVSHLDHVILNLVDIDNNGNCFIGRVKTKEKLYTKKEVIKLCSKAFNIIPDNNIIIEQFGKFVKQNFK